VTSRTVFGDFLDAARGHLTEAGRLNATAGGDADIQQANRSMLRVVVLMRRFVMDVTPGWVPEPPRGRRVLAG
jgi:hypothetical protein